MLRTAARSALARPLVALGIPALLLTGCSGGGGGTVGDDRSPEEVMELAKTTFDETSGVRISLTTDDLPEGVTGIVDASGVGTRAPAFEGSITVVLMGQQVQVPVVAVDDTVYAQVPLAPGWQEIDPAEYGAPDPAGLMSSETGLSSLLPATTGLEEGESVRGGADNAEVLTEYTGTVPDTAVRNIIPSASGDFGATYTLTAEGELRTAALTGVFYPDSASMTYTIGFDDYGTEQDITAP